MKVIYDLLLIYWQSLVRDDAGLNEALGYLLNN